MGERKQRFLASAPKLRKKDVDAINALFTAYVFRRQKTGEIWTTCCRKHVTLPADHPIWYEAHESEPRRWERPSAWRDGKAPRTTCPICGRKARIKDTRYSGQRKNLWEEQHVVVLRAVKGVLWACAAWVEKDYEREDLCAPPYAKGGSTYRFGKDAVTWVWTDWYYGPQTLHREPYKALNKETVAKPFNWTAQWGDGYYVIGLDELKKTRIAYCGGEAFLKEPCDFVKWLHLAFARPRQVEMLHKFGLDEVVTDLLNRGKKNVALFDWKEPDPRKSFDMTFDELRAAKDAEASVDDMILYKVLRKRGMRKEWEYLTQLREFFGHETERAVRAVTRHGVTPSKLYRYTKRFAKGRGHSQIVQLWLDYVRMAENLGWSLNEESVLLPKDLRRRHDEAAAEENERLHQIYIREHAEELAKQQKQLAKRHRRYDFELNGYMIRLANDPQEIIAEGKTLKHCVGGYAERHMSGRTTILFLRQSDAPGVSLYTIEMNGTELRQIHGYRNEKDGAPNPRKTMAWLLAPWLAWIAAGSKRDKQGKPKIPQAAKTA